jgi:hypothetical protein
MAFADGFDAAYSLKHDLQTILKQSVDILMYTDSMSLFDVEIAQLAFLRTN